MKAKYFSTKLRWKPKTPKYVLHKHWIMWNWLSRLTSHLWLLTKIICNKFVLNINVSIVAVSFKASGHLRQREPAKLGLGRASKTFWLHHQCGQKSKGKRTVAKRCGCEDESEVERDDGWRYPETDWCGAQVLLWEVADIQLSENSPAWDHHWERLLPANTKCSHNVTVM